MLRLLFTPALIGNELISYGNRHRSAARILRRPLPKEIIPCKKYLLLSAAVTWGLDAVDFYNQGLNNSLAYKKVEYFTKALQLDPGLVEAYEQRGLHYYFQRRFDKAIADYTSVIELLPGQADQMELYEAAYSKHVEADPYSPDFPPLNVPIILKAYTPNTETAKSASWFGLLGIIVISFALIFQLSFRAPKKPPERNRDKSGNQHLDNS